MVGLLMCNLYFYPRSPCGERLQWEGMRSLSEVISIHALLAESDSLNFTILPVLFYFYPRSPCGERLLTGGSSCDDGNFYPRSPCGERRSNQPVTMRTWKFLSTLSLRRATGILAISLRIVFAEFLSTLSLRRATAFSFALLYSTTISIHALLAESDGILGRRLWYREQFLSTLSLRRATKEVTYGRFR